jgi:EAL domain-containing protein (putative c-di-GMP-specific phosphodiesterase class I)
VTDEESALEAGVGVNSPEFLQKKIERLKTALDEANVLMDRQVTERDEARAQLDVVRRENAELRQQLEQLQAAGPPAPVEEAPPPPPPVDPQVEQQLREQIAQLERERDAMSAAHHEAISAAQRDAIAAAQVAGDDTLRQQLAALQAELEGAKRDLDTARRDADAARAQAATAQSAAATAAAQAANIPAGGRRPMTDGDLPVPGPFVSQEVIRDALDNDNFVLFCQPVFSLQAERITQYELLLRLRDSDGRMVRPFGFLEPADRYGLMSEIDRWVVQHALDILTRDVTGDLRLEVNLAGQSLGDYELTSLIEQHIAMTDLDPGRLILEVSENVAAAHLEDCERFAKRLRGLGIGFALDDFGSTFASFRHLRDLPVNYLKIDGDLVVTVTESRTGQLTIKSLVELAKGLGAETIAEYVSDDQTLEFLREQGVGYAQGYRIGRPRPIDEVLDMQGTHEAQPAPPTRVERPALSSGDEQPEAPEGEHVAEPEVHHDEFSQ